MTPLKLEDLSPREIVAELDKHIVGQNKAKRAVAIALRNRVRRKKLPEELQDEVAPKNIIMIGPTGVGKTEIARRLSKLSGAPFLKVEATKYTEVGYVGRDVESMVRDLMSVGVNMVRAELQEDVRAEAERRAEDAILDLLIGTKPSAPFGQNFGASGPFAPGAAQNLMGINFNQLAQNILQAAQQGGVPGMNPVKEEAPKQETPKPEPKPEAKTPEPEDREQLRKKLRAGYLEDEEVEVSVNQSGPAIEIFSGPSMEEIDLNLGNLGNILGGRKKKKRLPIRQAREFLIQEEMGKLVDADRVNEIAKDRVENLGMIFIDEIDKIASRGGSKGSGPDVSREGVQRDILPIVEGCQVNTKFGIIDTQHILFIAAGAFHMSKPSDLIPELQGRFPIRVELEALTEDDFYRILTQPANSLTRQYIELLKTEGVEVTFTDDAIHMIAHHAAEVNAKTENIGARRLATIMEFLLEELSYHAPDMKGQKITITPEYVSQRVSMVVADQDLSRYIL